MPQTDEKVKISLPETLNIPGNLLKALEDGDKLIVGPIEHLVKQVHPNFFGFITASRGPNKGTLPTIIVRQYERRGQFDGANATIHAYEVGERTEHTKGTGPYAAWDKELLEADM